MGFISSVLILLVLLAVIAWLFVAQVRADRRGEFSRDWLKNEKLTHIERQRARWDRYFDR